MKKNTMLAKVLSAIICLTVVMTMIAACKGGKNPVVDPDDNDNGVVDKPPIYVVPDNKGVVISPYAETEHYLAKDDKTDYKVVVPQNATKSEYNAATRLVKYFADSTGITLPIVADNTVTGDRYISVGATEQAHTADITATINELGNSGYKMKTIGSACYLIGTVNGADFAVTEFLAHTVGYRMYTPDEVMLVSLSEVKLRAFDLIDTPDIASRTNGYGLGSTEYSSALKIGGTGWMLPRNSNNAWHNSFDYFPKSMFGDRTDYYAANGKQISYTANGNAVALQEMINEAAQVIIDAAIANPDGERITLTMEDNDAWCTSAATVADLDKYNGARTSSVIKFVNKVSEKVTEYMDANQNGRTITIFFFSYAAALDAPAKLENGKWVPIDEEVALHENVGVMYAPIQGDFTHGLSEQENIQYATILKKWQDMGAPIALWTYQTYFWDYFMPYDSFNSMQDWYSEAKKSDIKWLYDQGQWDNRNSTAFGNLKTYLNGRLSWDTGLNVGDLISEYFVGYFKDAALPMRKYFDALRTRMVWIEDEMGIDGWVGTRGFYSVDAFPYGTLKSWQTLIDEAYTAVSVLKDSQPQVYQLVHHRIMLESLTVRYMMIQLHSQMFTNTQLLAMKQNFKSDCGKLNITLRSERNSVSSLWTEWGI